MQIYYQIIVLCKQMIIFFIYLIMSNINNRILQVIDYLGLNRNSFSKKIGIDNNVTIGNIVGGRQNKPSYDVLEKILQTFDSINSEWLITGKGEMLKTKACTNPIELIKDCQLCKEKDKVIKVQNELIEQLKKNVSHLEDKLKDCLGNSPKKKVS